MVLKRFYRIPLVFRLSALLLLVCFTAGQVLQRQPGGAVTRLLLAEVARRCPSAAFTGSVPTVDDGEHAFDRATWRLMADRFAPRLVPRCHVMAGRGGPAADRPEKHGVSRHHNRPSTQERRHGDGEKR